MWQEILLFGQVSAEIHGILRQQLAGVTRMQRQPVLERHLIFRPFPPPGLSNVPAGGLIQGAPQLELQKTKQMINSPLNYVQLVGILKKEGFDSQIEKPTAPPGESESHEIGMTYNKDELKIQEGLEWYLEFRDIPEPGKVSATARTISKTRILDGDPLQFLKDLGYE